MSRVDRKTETLNQVYNRHKKMLRDAIYNNVTKTKKHKGYILITCEADVKDVGNIDNIIEAHNIPPPTMKQILNDVTKGMNEDPSITESGEERETVN